MQRAEEGGRSSLDTTLLGGRVLLEQPEHGYRAAIDAVLLAAAAEPPQGARVLELGCGVGAAILCLLARRPDLHAVGVELQPELAALARRNARANRVEARLDVVEGDAAALPEALRQESFDWVIGNPPFNAAGAGGASPHPGKDLANREGGLDLAGWIDAMLRRLRPQGGLTLVHRADRLPDLLAALQGRAGAVALLPLWPKAGQPAKRLLLAARKGSRAPACLLPGLVLHRKEEGYTAEAQGILRDGDALPMG